MTFLASARIKPLWVLCILCGSVLNCLALDREAFSITTYDLNVRIEPEQHRLGVRGKITLRNETQSPQKIAVLQISSSLDWKSIKLGDKAVQFLTQPLSSDIDHTGGLSEAIVTLPQAVAPKETIELEIGYEGLVVLNTTRLTRIGTPENVAQSSDWDEIGTNFTAVRGAGYVAWYPIATEAANLSEADLFDVLGRWKARESGSRMEVRFVLPTRSGNAPAPLAFCSGTQELWSETREGTARLPGGKCTFSSPGSIPTFVLSDLQRMERPSIDVYSLSGHDAGAAIFVEAAEKIVPFVTEWFGKLHDKAQTVDLPDPNAAPFESGALLLAPLAKPDAKLFGLAAAHQLTHAAFLSPRPWIEEGLAHFAQALYLEHEQNRQAALVYMGLHRAAFMEAEKTALLSRSADDNRHALVNTTSEELYRSKAMCVWWMLRDMIGDEAFKKALAAYQTKGDIDPSYMPRLISAQTQRDLTWFFDDWLYHDRGLPDFKVESVFPAKTGTDTYMVSITVDNLGTAGAEVPVIVRSASGDVVKRIVVRAKSKATIRVETPVRPTEVVVNDGSVPESDVTNNVFRVDPTDK